jgi:hypothetical protein
MDGFLLTVVALALLGVAAAMILFEQADFQISALSL